MVTKENEVETEILRIPRSRSDTCTLEIAGRRLLTASGYTSTKALPTEIVVILARG